jgi:hypothetical protein
MKAASRFIRESREYGAFHARKQAVGQNSLPG